MDRLEKQQFIRRLAAKNQTDPAGARVYWSRHAILEMVKDDLTRLLIEQALQQGEIIEDYPAGHRLLPDCLVLAFLPDMRPLHAVIAIDANQDRIFMSSFIYLPQKGGKMIGEQESNVCPVCGGTLQSSLATIPFILESGAIVVLKDVPAEICGDCHEPFTAGHATDRVIELLRRLEALGSEVSVVAYAETMAV